MKLIVGLGNPGDRYRETYHNLGFIAVDTLAEKLNLKFTLKASMKCMLASANHGGEKFLVAKPQTFMNLSGESVRAIVDYYGIAPKDILVIYDDLDVSVGELRYREKGSAGTHNGMRNIIAELGHGDFPRLRIGSKKTNENIPTIDYVLSAIDKEQRETYKRVIDRAAELAYDFICGKSDEYLMQTYNGKAQK